MRNEPCRQCGNYDFYERGKFSYCRPCHNEAQRRYEANKKMGVEYSPKKNASGKTLEYLLTTGMKGSKKRAKTHCPRNHRYSGDNLRVEESDGKIHRRCKACERDMKRVAYGLAPEPDPTRLSDLLDES